MNKHLKSALYLSFSLFLVVFSACDNEPIDPGIIDNGGGVGSCEEATEVLITATTNYNNASPEDVGFEAICVAYANALQGVIIACGDTDGALQGTLDTLDCEPSDSACQDAQLVTLSAEAQYQADPDNTALCNAYKTALVNEINACGDMDGSLQTLIDTLNCTTGGTTDGEALMTANLDGEQFDNLKPNGYNMFQKAISMETYSYANDDDYIKIQGNSTYAEIVPNEYTKEINLHIPQSNWAVGTYPLQTSVAHASSGDVNTHYNVIYNNGDGNSQAYELEGGTITITEFNLTTRVIRGTFEFQYTRYFVDTNEETGPFDCINGTFDYSLDDSYFD
ncbi:hypothetical protein OS188_10140 [Xanthomarina sp. F1114]|uniref:hypothetical protein n=1 Tax=Xanthomarina sp. F1114 TaxID=2996019 RepID=UPI00225E429F|nr:hypothetical protein [Xanthomarina sp. F1114]MCX7548310.1 hypothetical protein [Xanthomarina sp. F1114]